MVTGSYLSIITLNVNGLNAPSKRQRLAEWIQKQDPSICCLQQTHLKTRDAYRLKMNGWKKIFHTNRNQKKAGLAILISDKIDFKTKAVKRDKEGHSCFLLVSICVVYLFPALHFQSVCVPCFEVGPCKQHIEGSYFCIHSASLCLLVGAFNPFTFKVIIDKCDPVTIYFIVLGSSLYTLFMFPV